MWIDSLILGVFVCYSVAAGFYHRKKASRGPEDYFLAGRTLKGWQAGLSMSATQFAADTPLLVTGLVATAGLFSLWRLWIYALAFLLMGFVLGTSWRRAGVLTDAELTELRYGGRGAFWLRVLKAVHLGTFVNCTVLAMVLIAAARIAEPFLPWHAWLPAGWTEPVAEGMRRIGFALTTLPEDHPRVWIASADNLLSISAIVLFVWLYSATGGLRSVVATDVVQFCLAMAATAGYAWIVLRESGGWRLFPDKLEALYGPESAGRLLSFGPADWSAATWAFCGVLAVQWFAQVNADGTGYLAQRTMACRTDRDARSAAVIFTFAQVLFRSLLWLPIAVGLLILYPVEGAAPGAGGGETFRILREAVFAQGIRDFLPAGLRGLMLTGMLAALASTVDTHLNWGASYWTNDLYKRLLMEGALKRTPSDRELVRVARASTVGILAMALVIAVNLQSIQDAWHLSLLLGAGLGGVLILRWVWYRINLYSELTAGAVSLTLSPVLLFGFPQLSEEARMLWMVGISTAAVLAVTLLTRPERPERLRAFYERARPCGFWGAVAQETGENPADAPRRLRRELGSVLLTAAGLLTLLIGAGSALIQAPRGAEWWGPAGWMSAGLFFIGLRRLLCASKSTPGNKPAGPRSA